MTLVDGQAMEQLPVDDRGLQYGDGVFETMRAEGGRVALLDRHLARLATGCAALGFDPPPEVALCADVARLVAAERGRVVIKLIVTRGSGSRGYSGRAATAARRIAVTHPFPEWPTANWHAGVRIRTCATRLAIGGPLAGLKHLGRCEQVLARSEWEGDDPAEGLMLDAEGSVVSADRKSTRLNSSHRL